MKLTFLVILQLLAPSALADFNYGRMSDITLGTAVVASIASMPTWEKRGVATIGHVANFGINYGLKKAFSNKSYACRPDGSTCEDGFPSGHSQSSMFGAGLLCREYGGLPCAGGVGLGLTTMLGRYRARRHSPLQVSAGGALGFSGGFYGVTLTGTW